jgi:hypothetical protein
MKILNIFISIIIVFAVIGCGSKGGILSQKEMTKLLIDIRISEAILQQYSSKTHNTDSIKKQSVLLYRAVFDKHNTTYAQYQKSVDWYMEHPKTFKKISEEVNTKFMQLRDSAQYEIIPQNLE